MSKSDGDPTPRRKPRTFDLLVYCECGRAGGRLHGIAPGCPGMADELLQYTPGETPGTIRSRYDPDFVPEEPDEQGRYRLIPTPDEAGVTTVEVIQSLREELEYKGATAGTFVSYEKQWKRIAAAFPRLPEDHAPLLGWLRQFENPKYRALWHQTFSQLYKHAVKGFGFPANPFDGIPRPQVSKKPVVALTLEEVRALDTTPVDDQERLILDLLLGHGWRGIELRRLTAADARGAKEGEIWVRGKERSEWAPFLEETRSLLLKISQEFSDDDQVLRARRTRGGIHEPLGDDGLRIWVADLCRRADIRVYKPHDLRRTFGTLVARHQRDSHLAELLLRHGKPSVTDRYIQWELPGILEQFSPVHLARLTRQEGILTGQPPGESSLTGPGPAGRASSSPG